MPKVRVLVKSFINGNLIDPETMPAEACIIEYEGKVGSNLELVEEEKPKRGRTAAAEE